MFRSISSFMLLSFYGASVLFVRCFNVLDLDDVTRIPPEFLAHHFFLFFGFTAVSTVMPSLSRDTLNFVPRASSISFSSGLSDM